jgi:hypothetical protein
LEIADKIWVIHIDATKSYIKGSFLMIAHVTFANKIAQAVLSANLQWKESSWDIAEITLSKSQEEDLNRKFSRPSHEFAKRQQELFMEKIEAVDDELEYLL